MKFLAIERDLKKADKKTYDELLIQEANAVHQLYLQGIVREIYFNEHNNAILMLECDDRNCALDYINDLPLVKERFVEFELMQLSPYTGFSRLFSF